MKFSNCNGGPTTGQGEEKERSLVTSSMAAHVLVRENALHWWTTVQGLHPHEIRLLTEKVSDPPESCQERTVQFSIPTWQVLNGLERLGYRVISCGSLLTGYTKFDTKDVIWTLHKTREDWEAGSSK